jgi:hypothetical protein
MIEHVIAALAVLALPAVLPTIALVGARPITAFMTPLVGAVLASFAALFEGVLGGTLLLWFVILAVLSNVVAIRHIGTDFNSRMARVRSDARSTPGRVPRQILVRPSTWSILTVMVMAVAVAWPMQALKSPIIVWDGYAIWTLHALFIYGGHGSFPADLTNPVYQFSNPSYPPLIPAGGALSFAAAGDADLRLAVIITAVLNACALATVGCAIASIVDNTVRTLSRITALIAGGCICLIGFGLSGVYGVGGYADLLWAASALAAVIIGLFLPRRAHNLLAAWVCAVVAGLTKNEGFITACLVLALIAMRYVPLRRNATSSTEGVVNAMSSNRLDWLAWCIRTTLLTAAMVIPGVFWYAFVNFEGIGSNFVGRSSQSLQVRFDATAPALNANLHVAPLAIGIAIVGYVVVCRTRRQLSIGNDLWLWGATAGSLLALIVTYVFGALEIHWWLSTSASRTTIFANLTMYADIAVWLIVAVSFGAGGLIHSSIESDQESPAQPSGVAVGESRYPTGERKSSMARSD